MSRPIKDHKFPSKNSEKLGQILAPMIAEALRADYGKKYSSIKQITQHADASMSTIKKWYEGRNPPNSVNLILLAKHSPSVAGVLMKLIGRYELWRLYQREILLRKRAIDAAEKALFAEIYYEESFGINVRINFAVGNKLNARQLWFLGLLQQGQTIKAEHIALVWSVTTRTAEADIAKMVKAKLIHFVGAKKTGRYEVFSDPSRL